MISFTLREMTGDDIPAVQLFLIQHLNEFFAADRPVPDAGQDVFNLQQQYIQQQRNVLLCAWSEKHELIATLAVCQYDDRIAELRGRYILTETAEICRCYVDKRYRRKGIGGQLLAFAETFCEQQRYNYYTYIPIIFYREVIHSGDVIIFRL